MFGSQDRRTLMTLGKLIFFLDILFSKSPKHQMVMSSEHQLKIIELFTGKLRQLSCPLSSEYLCIL